MRWQLRSASLRLDRLRREAADLPDSEPLLVQEGTVRGRDFQPPIPGVDGLAAVGAITLGRACRIVSVAARRSVSSRYQRCTIAASRADLTRV